MNKKYSLLLIGLLSIIFGLGLRAAPQQLPQERVRVLLLGDSWAGYMVEYQAYQQAFDAFGYPEVLVDGSLTKIAGTANTWAQASSLKLIVDKLNDTPSIDMVVVSLGGNDLIGKWQVGMNPADEEALFAGIRADLETIVKLILEVRPEIEVLLAGYDYPNFVETVRADGDGIALQAWEAVGQPTTQQINIVTVFLEQQKAEIANEFERVYFVQGLGLMQYLFGYPQPPQALGAGFEPNQVPFPGQTGPDFGPFPGGDINYPTPPEALGQHGADPIHLNARGYVAVARNQMLHYFLPKLRGEPAFSITTVEDGLTGWLRSDGEIGWDSIRIGRDNEGGNYTGLISFDTAEIHNRAEIVRATITLVSAEICCPQQPLGSAGLNTASVAMIESGADIEKILSSAGTRNGANENNENVGMFYGSGSEEGAQVRIELNEAGLANINKQGLTTFVVYFQENSATDDRWNFYHGEDQNLQARLDVYYSLPAFSIVDLLNPATQIFGIPVMALIVISAGAMLTLVSLSIAVLIVLRSRKNTEE